jgi:hypothetical protein
LAHFALATADPAGYVPIGFWMHRGCVPFISFDHFNNIYWPTLKPIVQQLWAQGHQTLFYAEGNWDYHLESFAELPERSIVYHVDQGDIFHVRDVLGERFCLSGGVPNFLLAFRTPREVREQCRRLIEGVAQRGGYIMDASAIVQNDARVENIRAMTEATLEYGVYSRGHAMPAQPTPPKPPSQEAPLPSFGQWFGRGKRPPGTCIPWSEIRKELPEIQGDEKLCQSVWQSVDALGYMYVWWIALAF